MGTTMSNLKEHAEKELRRAGMLGAEGDKYDEYNNMCGEAVLELIDVFQAQNHSGFSASMVLGMFKEVAEFKPLSPLTNDPEEWMEVDDKLWQNRRNSEAFSTDGGYTYYLLSDKIRYGWKRKLFGIGHKYYSTEVVHG